MIYYHTDVFSKVSLAGNGLTVIFQEEEMEAAEMLKTAQEFKQFETIFLLQTGEKRFRARIFTVEEELDFAGHPLIGAAAAIHDRIYKDEKKVIIRFELNKKQLETESEKESGFYQALMRQGVPEFLCEVSEKQREQFANALNLQEKDLHQALPMEVISTGLPYLIVPLSSGLEHARIKGNNLEEQLKTLGAKFLYLIDPHQMEGRTWDNLGAVEDVATGSAAGPVCAYLCKWNICKKGQEFTLHQGSYVGRPSEMKVIMDQDTDEIKVMGAVKIVVIGEMQR